MSPRLSKAWPAAAVLLFAKFLPGQSADVLGPRNAAFLEALWRNGYIDEAMRIGELVAASKLPDAEKKRVDTIYDRLKLAKMIQGGDSKGRRDLIVQNITEKKAEVDAAPANSEAQIDKLAELIDQYRLLADAMVAVLAQETDAAAQATARKDADQMFEAFEKDLKDRATVAAKLRDDKKEGSEIPYLVCMYGLGRAYYYHALLFPADDYGGKKLIEKALAVLEDFDLEFGDSFAAFEAKLTVALCQSRLGDVNTAIEVCNDAIALRTRFDQDKKTGIYPVDANARDVIAAAVLQKTLFLKELKEHSKVLEATKDYLTTIPKPLEAPQGPNVLAAQAEAQIELGDTEGATKSAEQLVAYGGIALPIGQKLLSNLISGGAGSKTMGPDKMLSIAQGLAQQGDLDGSLRMCRQVLLHAKGPEGVKVAADAMLLTGAVFANRGWFQEASVAFDAVVRRYPKTEAAPDALWRSIQCFIELDDAEGLMKYRGELELRKQQLQRDYPTHPHVGQLQLVEGKRMSKAGKFLEAAQLFERIAKESTAYLDARFYASSSYQSHARELERTGKAAEATSFLQKALEGFQAVMRDAESNKQSTTNPQARARLEGVEIGARIAVANLLLSGTGAKPAEAEAVLKSIDVKPDDKQYPTIAAVKIRILLAQGNLDQAADAMDIAIEKGGEHRDLLAVCRTLASALDDKAVEREKAKDRRGAEALWRRAGVFYVRGASTANKDEVAVMAERLRVIGMVLNDIDPNKQESWYETPAFKPRVSEPWEHALQLYQRLAESDTATYKARIGRAWILGFLGRFDEAEADLTNVFKENKLGVQKKLDTNLLQKRPELLVPYLELAFVLRAPRPGGGDQKARLVDASQIFDRINLSVKPDSKHWWYSRYGLMHTLYDRGIYDDADVSMKSLERTNGADFDGDRFGLKQALLTLKAQIKMKVPARAEKPPEKGK